MFKIREALLKSVDRWATIEMCGVTAAQATDLNLDHCDLCGVFKADTPLDVRKACTQCARLVKWAGDDQGFCTNKKSPYKQWMLAPDSTAATSAAGKIIDLLKKSLDSLDAGRYKG